MRVAVVGGLILVVLIGAFLWRWQGGDGGLDKAVTEFKSGNYHDALPVLESEASQGKRVALFLVALAYSCKWAPEGDFADAQSLVDTAPCKCDKGKLKYDVAIEIAQAMSCGDDPTLSRRWLESAASSDSYEPAALALKEGKITFANGETLRVQ